MRRYKLVGQMPVLVPRITHWREWIARHSHERQVKLDRVGRITISTVFTGMDQDRGSKHLPLVFATLTFEGNGHNLVPIIRSATWNEALEIHRLAVERVRRNSRSPENK